jgi:curved DNA-binding protein CbpA
MKFDSPIFDRIRVKPDEDRRLRSRTKLGCEWPGCDSAGTHRAPKGRGREREYWRFSLAHVREYNQSYNYFAGMSDEAVIQYQKDAITGHRPTWKIGMNSPISGPKRARPRMMFGEAADPFGLFTDPPGSRRNRAEARAREGRTVRNAERKALATLGLEPDADKVDIKARFKVLVKRHHPDANGGDRACEDQLREIIQAYNYLKSAGFC